MTAPKAINPKCSVCRFRSGAHKKFIKAKGGGVQTSWRCEVCWRGKNQSGFKGDK